jgi:predicted nucleic acid-binding protein
LSVLHFDTNALIALPHWARDGDEIVERVLGGEAAAASTIVWYEFLIGPLQRGEADLARAFIQGRVVVVEEADAELAAHLFNTVGRQRALKTDALIAAIAIRADAELVTLNRQDFLPFAGHGLRLGASDLAL